MEKKLTQPLASVIIPCFNAEKTLPRTVRSLELQSCKDFEVLLVDDGSTDGTLALAKRLQAASALSITVLPQRHLGVGAARNRALECARGKYIFFLDADDIYHSRFVQIMTELGEASKIDLILSHQDRDLQHLQTARENADAVKPIQIADAMTYYIYHLHDMCFGAFAYRREKIEALTLRFSEQAAYAEDREFVFKYAAHCSCAAILPNRLYGYAVNADSVTGQYSWSWVDNIESMLRTEQYLADNHAPYLKVFENYMLPRAAWTTLNKFAFSRRLDWFRQCAAQYPIRTYMKRLVLSADEWLLRLSAVIYLIHPMLFYAAVGCYGRIKFKPKKRGTI